MMTSVKPLVQNTTYLTLAFVGQKVVAFLYFALLARWAGVDVTGAYFYVLTVSIMFGSVADFGLTSVLVREVAKHPEQRAQWLGDVCGLKVIFGVLASGLAVGTGVWLDVAPEVFVGLLLAIAIMLLDSLHLTLYGVLRGLQRLKAESWGMVIGQGVIALVGTVVLLVHPTLVFLLLALMAGSVWNVVFSGFVLSRRGLLNMESRLTMVRARRAVRMALPFAIAAVCTRLYSSVDTLLLERLGGTELVGLYSVASKLTYAFQFLPMAFIAGLYPAFSAHLAADKRTELSGVFERSLWYMALLAVPIALGVFTTADLIVPFIYGAEYAPAIPALQWLVMSLLFLFLDFPVGSLLNADDRQATKTRIMVGTALVNICLNLLLIPAFGLVGASVSAVVSYAGMLLFGLIAIQKSVHMDWLGVARRLWPIVVSGIAMVTVVLLTKSTLSFGVIPLGGLVYVGGLFWLGGLSLKDLSHMKSSGV